MQEKLVKQFLTKNNYNLQLSSPNWTLELAMEIPEHVLHSDEVKNCIADHLALWIPTYQQLPY